MIKVFIILILKSNKHIDIILPATSVRYVKSVRHEIIRYSLIDTSSVTDSFLC